MTDPAKDTSLPNTVLVVDDEQVVLNLLSAAFRKAAIRVRSASSLETARAALLEERFGCVMTDKNLAGNSGFEVIREVKRMQPFSACILMTGFPTPESVLEAMRAGAMDYLEKPFPDLKLVVQKVQTAMEHQRTAFERAAMVEELKVMEIALRSKDAQVFQHQTELDLLKHVVELRIDDATRELSIEQAKAEGELVDARAAFRARLDEIKSHVRILSERAGHDARRATLTVPEARVVLADLERLLLEFSETL